MNALDGLGCFGRCLAEHLQPDVVVCHRADLVPRQSWRVFFNPATYHCRTSTPRQGGGSNRKVGNALIMRRVTMREYG